MRKKLVMAAAVLAVVSVATAPALAQAPVAMVDCVIGGPCIGTSGNDTINGSELEDVIYGLEGDDIIDPGNDAATDYVFCGPGFDVVNQMPGPLPEPQQGFLQYEPEPDFIADDCEERAL